MAWGKAGSTTLASAGNDLDVTFTASKFNQLMVHLVQSADASMFMNFENNSSTDYAYRHSANGSEQTEVNQTKLNWTGSLNQINPNFMVMNIMNISGKEKLGIGFVVSQTSAGAGNAPSRKEYYVKFDTTTDSGQITRVDFHSSATNAIPAGSNVSVLGSDLTPSAGKPTNVQAGSRWEETDTRKMYHYGGGGGSITKDNQDIVQRGTATPSNGSGTGLVSGTFSNFAVGNNSNRVLIIASGCYNASPNITGVTFNGSENFEKITQYKPASNFNHEFWILYNPTVTTADVVITYGSAGGSFQDGAGQTGAICYSFYNVKQSDAFGTPVEKNSGASATPFIAITPTTAGSMIIDCYFSGAGSPVPNNDETDGMNIICGGVDRSMASQYDLNPTIGSVNNMSRTSGNSSYSQIAVEIKAAVDEWKELGT